VNFQEENGPNICLRLCTVKRKILFDFLFNGSSECTTDSNASSDFMMFLLKKLTYHLTKKDYLSSLYRLVPKNLFLEESDPLR
jgi:hypothetical protein